MFRCERWESRLFYIVVLWGRNQGNVPIMPNYVNIALERAFALAILATLFYRQNTNIKHQKSVAGQKERKPKQGKGATPRQGMFC